MDSQTAVSAVDGQKDKQVLTLIVSAPRSPTSKTFSWPKTTTVGEAAREAALAFGYAAGTPGLQLLTPTEPRALDNKKPLVAERLKDGDELEIVDTGGGV